MEKKNTAFERFSRSNWVVLIIFGLVGQIAWSMENMYFNVFVYNTIAKDLDTVTLMVQLSGITATVATLIAGVISDKVGNRRSFISWGYIIWGITVAMFGMMSNELTATIFGIPVEQAVAVTLVLVIIADCVMTLFGSTANDAAFNSWLTDNTKASFRGTVEGVVSILPLVAMLVVAGGFGILRDILGSYKPLFLGLGAVISLSGIFGLFMIKDSDQLVKTGTLKDIFYGFRPSVIKEHKPLYLTLIAVGVYGIAFQIFMPYLIIYMEQNLKFSPTEYSIVFGGAIVVGAVINVFLGIYSDKKNKAKLLYIAAGVMALGLFGMYFVQGLCHIATLILFGITGFVMITGYIFVTSLCGSMVRDHTPEGAVGKLQGVRMVFSVLIPMIVGPMIGNYINKTRGILMEDPGANAMTTSYIPAPEIFLVGAIVTVLLYLIIPFLTKTAKKNSEE